MKPRMELAVENSDGELVVLDKHGGEVHQLNKAASLIWHGLSEGLGIEEIAIKLTSTFEVEHETAVTDVNAAVKQFEELGLLEN